MKYVKSFDQFINESEDKESLNEKMYEAIKAIYNEACMYEDDEDPAHKFESFLKESFLLMAEMTTRVLKENSNIALGAAKAAMKKHNDKYIDDRIVTDKTHEYLNEIMKDIKELFCDKMEEMMQENPVIAQIAAEALSQKNSETNPNNID